MKKKLKVGGGKSRRPQQRSEQPAPQLLVENEVLSASVEFSPPINAEEDLFRAEKFAEAGTVTLGPPSTSGSSVNLSAPDFMQRNERNAGTFAVIKVERDKGNIHFRLRADIDPGWMIQQHRARQAAIEAAAEEGRKLAKVAEFKRKTRANQLDRNGKSRRRREIAAMKSNGEEQQVQPKSGVKLIRAVPKSAKEKPVGVAAAKRQAPLKAAQQKISKVKRAVVKKLQLKSVVKKGGVSAKAPRSTAGSKTGLKKKQPTTRALLPRKKVVIKNTKTASLKTPPATRKRAKEVVKTVAAARRQVPTANQRQPMKKEPAVSQPRKAETRVVKKAPLQNVPQKNAPRKNAPLNTAPKKNATKKNAPVPPVRETKNKGPNPVKRAEIKVTRREVLVEEETVQLDRTYRVSVQGPAENQNISVHSQEVVEEETIEINQSFLVPIQGEMENQNTNVHSLEVVREETQQQLADSTISSPISNDTEEEISTNMAQEVSGSETNSATDAENSNQEETSAISEEGGRISSEENIQTDREDGQQRSSESENGFVRRLSIRRSVENFVYDDNSPIDDPEDRPDEFSTAFTDDELELIKEKVEEKKRKLKQVKLAEYNNIYNDYRTDWQNFEVQEDEIDYNEALMEILDMRRRSNSGKMRRNKRFDENEEWLDQEERRDQDELMARRGESVSSPTPSEPLAEIVQHPAQKSMLKKKSMLTKWPKPLVEDAVPEIEEVPSQFKMCDTCGWMTCPFEKYTPDEPKEGEEPQPEIQHGDCAKCGVDVVKERPTSKNCINCTGVFGSDTLFELEFDMKAKKSKVICSICKEPLRIGQKERRVKRVPPQGLRMDLKRDPVLREIFLSWSEKDDFPKGDCMPFDLADALRTVYQSSYAEAPELNVVRGGPPCGVIPPRPPYNNPTTVKVDYKWRGKGAKPEHPRIVCKDLNHHIH